MLYTIETSDTTKSVALALTYVAAYDAWWRSLMTPPLNAHKSAEHDALAVECHEAFVACGSGIQAARIVAQGDLQ